MSFATKAVSPNPCRWSNEKFENLGAFSFLKIYLDKSTKFVEN